MKLFFTILICCLATQITAQNITQAEYFFDSDPGIGNAIAIDMNSATEITKTLNLDISELSIGFHSLHIRAKNDNNIWGSYDKRLFYITQFQKSENLKLTEAEYFFDTDPGIGSATKLSFSDNSNEFSENYALDISNLSEGFHLFAIRVKNEEGFWSLYSKRTFYINRNFSSIDDEIVSAEYFFDTDPGIGSGTIITLSKEGTELQENLIIDTSNLPIGFHTFSIRVKNKADVWSLFESRAFYIFGSGETSKITNAEYFFNSYVPNGEGTTISITEDSEVNLSVEIPTNGLTEGNHLLFIRVQNDLGIWSLNDILSFTIDNSVLSINTTLDNNDFSIFPNPVKDVITIFTKEELTSYQFYNNIGKLVKVGSINDDKINIANLASGVYFCVLKSNKGSFIKKIIKE